jgi:hypothetical protein
MLNGRGLLGVALADGVGEVGATVACGWFELA